MLSLLFLGSPRIERNGKAIELDTRKAIALVAYLALTRAAHSRDALAALLYPDADQTHARAALRRTLSSLKTALGDTYLDVDREQIGLSEQTDLYIDVVEFRRCAAESDSLDALTTAARIYRGDFLEGFTLRDSPPFDEWQFFETEGVRRQFASVLEQLVELLANARAYKPALDHARRWLALDPLHEPAHRALMQLYAWDGQRAAALRQYRECVRLLDRELGVSPLQETVQLYEAIQENRLTAQDAGRTTEDGAASSHRITATSPTTILRDDAARRTTDDEPLHQRTTSNEHPSTVRRHPSSFSLHTYPFIGRAAELATLRQAYDWLNGQGHLLVIEGEAGIGKTRLAEEWLAYIQSRGGAFLVARCYSEQNTLAYAPFVEAMRGACTLPQSRAVLQSLPSQLLAEVARLVPEATSLHELATLPPLDSPGARVRFFHAISQVLRTCLAGEAPGVLFIDDAQWLDEASLDLLTFLVHRLRDSPASAPGEMGALALLLTWRSEDVPNDHRLRGMFADAQRVHAASRVILPRLSSGEVLLLVSQAANYGVPINRQFGERLYRESEGQPFFLVEYLRLLQSDQEMRGEWTMPASVRELLHSRLAHVGETARQLLSAAAVIGRSFDFDALREVSGRGEEETIAGLEELLAQGLVAETASNRLPQYDFTHDKLRVLIYDETSLARRRLLHRRAAEVLVNRGRGPTGDALAGQTARHFQLGGVEDRAADLFKRAGDHARALFANRDAVRHYGDALAMGYPDPALLHEALGDAQTLLGEYPDALTSYEKAIAFAAPPATSRLEHKLGGVYLRRGEADAARVHLELALKATDDAGLRARLHADLSLAAHRAGQTEQAHQEAERALELARRAGDDLALAQALNILGILERHHGQFARAESYLEQSLKLADALGDDSARSAALNNLSQVSEARGDLARALELTDQALALSATLGDRHREAALRNRVADLLHAVGRSDQAMQELKEAVAIYAEIGGAPGEWQPEIWKLSEW